MNAHRPSEYVVPKLSVCLGLGLHEQKSLVELGGQPAQLRAHGVALQHFTAKAQAVRLTSQRAQENSDGHVMHIRLE